MIKTFVTAALALFVSASAFAETSAVAVKDFDIYVDQPTGFVFVKLPAGWKFVSRIEQAELSRLPASVLTALLVPETADTLMAAQGPSQAQPLIERHTMNPQDITLVQTSWARVEPIAPQAAELFYNNLFELDPTLQSLFRGDMQAQGRKLMQMIGVAVGKLDDLATLVPVLQSLGARHGGYGVVDAHYDLVGAALLKTLGQGLGEHFDGATEAAWTRVYGVMASTMMAASRSVAA